MTALSLVPNTSSPLEAEVNSNQKTPSVADKLVLDQYIKSLKDRGFCKLVTASRDVQLYNRFDKETLSLSFISEDFSRWLYVSGKTCSFREVAYITRTLKLVIGSKFKPVDEVYITSKASGCSWVNTYRQYKPNAIHKNVSPHFLEYWERLFPNEYERNTVLSWIAHGFQNKTDRPSWHLMFPSAAGTGKGFLYNEILKPLAIHTTLISSLSKLTSSLSTVLDGNLFVWLDDCKAKTDSAQTSLKSMLSEETAYIEPKYQMGRMVNIYARFILASNEENPLGALDADERRWFVVTRMEHAVDQADTQRFIQTLSDWLKLPESLDSVYNWFMTYPINGFNAKHVPQSEALKAMIESSVNVYHQFIKSYIEDHKVFRNLDLMDAIVADGLSRPSSSHVNHILSECNYEGGQKRLTTEAPKIRLCYPKGMSMADIRANYSPVEF